jgi:drug/metabolite transporter (DMT)-like permease
VNGVAVAVALASAAFFALASVLQQRAVLLEPSGPAVDPRVLLRVLRRPLWLAGGLADLAGLGLQALALAKGPLAVVQPLLVSGLVLAVPLGAALDRRRPGRRDLAAVGLAALGLSVFLVTADLGAGISDPSVRAWGWIAATVGPVVLGCLALARRSGGGRRATYLGLATGALYGVTAALLKTTADHLGAGHPLAVLADWHLWALVVLGCAGLALNQNAFQGGPLAAPLTALTLTEPAVGVAVGVAAFHEHISAAGTRIPLLVAAAAAMACSIWLASTVRPLARGSGRPAPGISAR